tara:strand:- start:355 stop:591 length:237 start_codon:yes stop_codon:yes gene_type:complete
MRDHAEHRTVVKATVNVSIHSDRPLTEEEIHEMMANASYEIGNSFDGEDSYVFEDDETAYVCGTEWTDTDIVHLNHIF